MISNKRRAVVAEELATARMMRRPANFQGANLRDADLRSLDLQGADFREADLCGADLSYSKAYQADFQGANLHGASLYGTDLSEARGIALQLEGATHPFRTSLVATPGGWRLTFGNWTMTDLEDPAPPEELLGTQGEPVLKAVLALMKVYATENQDQPDNLLRMWGPQS